MVKKLKVEYRSKKDLVYQILKEALIDRRWSPGKRKSYNELSAQLHVSRTPIAEACKLLEKEGLVAIIPQVGVTAAYLSAEEIMENFKIRGVLEGLAGSEAIKHLEERDLNRLGQMFVEMEDAERKNDFSKFVEINRAFHRLIYHSSKMGQLIKILDQLWDAGTRYRLFYYRHLPKGEVVTNHYHQIILTALKSKNVSLVRSTLKKDAWEFGAKLVQYFEKNVLYSSEISAEELGWNAASRPHQIQHKPSRKTAQDSI